MFYRLLEKESQNAIRTEENEFTDVTLENWSNKHISTLSRIEVISGYEDKTFKPDQNITRSEFVTLVNKVLERMVEKEQILEGIKEYDDLKEDKWYYENFVEAINGHIYKKDEESGKEIWKELKDFDVDM